MKGTKSEIRKKIHKRKMIEQRIMGIVLLLICVVTIVMCMHAQTIEESDASPVLLLAPLGFCLLFSKECWIY